MAEALEKVGTKTGKLKKGRRAVIVKCGEVKKKRCVVQAFVVVVQESWWSLVLSGCVV